MALRGLVVAANGKKSNVARTIVILAISLVSSVGWMAALDPAHRVTQYGHTAWRIQDGYFGGMPWKITQAADGCIWIGTHSGLFRFDGVRFVPFSFLSPEPLPSTSIFSLLAARDGSLWIGTESGLFHWKNDQLIPYPVLREWVITSMVEDLAGRMWIGRLRAGDSSSPLCQVFDTSTRCYGSQDGAPAIGTETLAAGSSGDLWVDNATAFLKWRPGASTVYRPKLLQSNVGISGVEALTVAADGSLWVGIDLAGQGAGLQHMLSGTLKPFAAPKLDGETVAVAALFNDRENNLWVGTNSQGISRIHGSDVDHYVSADGLSSDFVNDFLEDREGNLWVATSNGIDMFRDFRVNTLSSREGLNEDSVDSILASRNGSVWIGNASHLGVLAPNGVFSQLGQALHGHQVTYLLEDHSGRLWVGMDNTLSIYEGGKERGTFRQIKRQDGSAIGMVMGLTEDSEHNIWVETHGPPSTLIRIQDLKVREEFPAPPMPIARKLVSDTQSGIWLGLVSGDLARFRSGNTETFTFANYPNA